MENKRQLTLGSLFSGSGGFELAGILAGIKPIWKSEISPFPVLVTHKRLPQLKHYGDISKLKGSELEPVDIITFGSPCVDLSVAGKREGIHAPRSGLFFQAIRIVKEMREATNGKYPRYAVYENVTGIFSSNKGEDFRLALEAFIGVKEEGVSLPSPEKGRWAKADLLLGNGWSVAYRTFDSQYWSVPQRRARIYVVADFNGESAGEILFKSDGLSGYSEESSSAWKRIARSIEAGIGTTSGQFCLNPQVCINPQGNDNPSSVVDVNFPVLNDQGGERMDITDDVTCTLRAQSQHPPCVIDEPKAAGFCTEHSAKARNIGYEEEKSPTLRAGVVPAALSNLSALSIENHPADSRVKISEDGKVQTLCNRIATGGGSVPMVAEPVPEIKAFGICSQASNGMKSDNPHVGFYEATTSRTLDKNGGNSVCNNQGGIAIVEAYNLTHHQAEKVNIAGALNCSTSHLSSNQGGTAIVGEVMETYDVRFTSEGTRNARGHCYKTDISRCLDTGGESPESNHGGVAILAFSGNQRDEVRDLQDCAGAVQAQPGMKQQTFIAIQGSVIGRQDKNGPQGSGVNEDVCFTLNTCDKHAIAMPDEDQDTTYATTVGNFMHSEKEKANTLMARDYKDPQIINDKRNSEKQDSEPAYIVRRLTPTECARLQAFPDWWCANLETPNPSDEEIAFWKNVWDEWNSMNGKKLKTERQIRKWLSSPYSDAAEYSLWGNGITLTVAWFVLAGIVWRA